VAHEYCTGPVAIYVGVGDTVTRREVELTPDNPAYVSGGGSWVFQQSRAVGKNPVFLGTCRKWPIILIKPEWKPIFTDHAGLVPDDLMFMGEHAYVIAEVNRYVETAYRSISARPYYWANRGRAYETSVGTMMLREGQSYPVWLVFPYAVKPIYRATAGGLAAVGFIPATGPLGILAGALANAPAAAMPAGYRFLECVLEGPDRLDPLGTMARSIHLAFHALPQHIKPASGGRRLYDHDMSAVTKRPT